MKSDTVKKHLLKRIAKKKEMLLLIVQNTGLGSSETVACSKELDRFILLYQKLNQRLDS
ncbi:hypothetical protein CVD28_12925 [Bacillus sp. M6-12]|uniref:aspartyl-phosphate phosphatase Spo0E family protein n=1 Tax=Bacillus sp. M6-12 TaxID=2054166 RepID=UPI000C756B7C|nr:aspartyl-phosphate phosphatase Spo0E family protein [Bacillus sp. M6-12]PLS17446.1 hypothetical protein CVD28_12925 [Bacillus sp. M6-12]